MESRMYQRIKPIEALRRARAQKVEIVDNIGIVIQTSNRVRHTFTIFNRHILKFIHIDC